MKLPLVDDIAKQRDALRRKLAAVYYVPGYGVPCVWCGKPVQYGAAHIHECLVRRAQVPKDKQHLIFVPENCALLHPQCHEEHDTDPELKIRFLWYIREAIPITDVAVWYRSLQYLGIMLLDMPFMQPEYWWDDLLDSWNKGHKNELPYPGLYSLVGLLAVFNIDRGEFIRVGQYMRTLWE